MKLLLGPVLLSFVLVGYGELSSGQPPHEIAGDFKRWQAQAESDQTDRHLSTLKTVSSNIRERIRHKQRLLKHTRAHVLDLTNTAAYEKREVAADLKGAKAEAKQAAEATDRVNQAIVDTKFQRIPLNKNQNRNLALATEIYTDAQEGAHKPDRERAARIAQLQADVNTQIDQYKSAPDEEHLVDPFANLRNDHRQATFKQARFRKEADKEEGAHKKMLAELHQKLDSLRPQMTALKNDQHRSRILDLQYDVVEHKLEQLKMINKYERNPTTEQQQAELHGLRTRADSQMETEINKLSHKLQVIAKAVQNQDSSSATAANLETAQHIIAAATPNQLQSFVGESVQLQP